MAGFPADVDVAIVAHNARATLGDTLDSLWRAGCPPGKSLSWTSPAPTVSLNGFSENWTDIRQYRLERNLGPSPGRNVGILKANRPFVFLMDADVFVEPEAVSLLRAAFDADPAIAIGSPVVVHAARPDVIQYAGTGCTSSARR